MEDRPITHEDLLWEARQPIELDLKHKLNYLEVNELKAYVKTADTKRAFDMMQKTLSSDIPDEKIKTACHYIRNTLFWYAHDLLRTDPTSRGEKLVPFRCPRMYGSWWRLRHL